MSEQTDNGAASKLSFKVKTSGDRQHNITMPESSTVHDLKKKLSGPDYENGEVDRMRLIYSGRVMKNEDSLASYKIKNGNTIHMVMSAASNPSASTAATTAGAAQPAIPTNMSAGTSASNPLDTLTGARYAGFLNLPSADLFGPNGGMAAPPSMDELANMVSNPQTLQAMNEALDNPAFLDMMVEQNPMLRGIPNARELMRAQLPAIRAFMADPAMLRAVMQQRRDMPGMGGPTGGVSAFPAPGATTTSGDSAASTGATQPPHTQQTQPGQQGGMPSNPWASLFGPNPMMNPFGAQMPPFGPVNAGGGAGGIDSSTAAANQQRMFENLMSMGVMPSNQPPEELYQDQLRQLNDMGFTDFDRNITALRRSGGSVQGAIEHLLNNP